MISRVCVVIARFSRTGVPLAQMRLARALAQVGFDVDFVVGHVEPGIEIPETTPASTVILGGKSARRALMPLFKYFRMRRPELVFSAEDHMNAVVSTALLMSGSDALLSLSSRITPKDAYRGPMLSKPWWLRRVVRFTNRRATVLTCVSEALAAEYRELFPGAKYVCAYNVVEEPGRTSSLARPDHPFVSPQEGHLLIAAGTLAPWKGYHDLLDAFAIVKSHRNVRLMVLGDGPLREELEGYCARKGIADAVVFLGQVADPMRYFRHARIFVHAAHVESFGNVLVEAMIGGCTPVAADASGPREILADGRYGYLAPVRDPVALAAAISTAIDEPIPGNILAEGASRFSSDAVVRRQLSLVGIAFNG